MSLLTPQFSALAPPDVVVTGHRLAFSDLPEVLDNEAIQALVPEQFQ